MIALVTDSNTQLPPGLRDRYRIRVVPMTIVVDGVAYLEGVDLDPVLFLRRLRAGAEMSTAAPSPGHFAAVYAEAAAAGAERIVSVHVGADLSGTLGSARLAAQSSPVPVDLVDTATASFAAGCCVWAAAEALASGADAAGAVGAARRASERIGNIFVVSSLDLARRGGRLEGGAEAARVPGLGLGRRPDARRSRRERRPGRGTSHGRLLRPVGPARRPAAGRRGRHR